MSRPTTSNIDERFVLHEESLDELYAWIDTIPLSRPKKNVSRDFSDGVLCAEAIAHFVPRLVELHNYGPANSIIQKKINWTTLNRKVLVRLGLKLSEGTIQQLAESKPGVIEQVLFDVRKKLDEFNSGIKVPKPSSRRVTTSFTPTTRSTDVSVIHAPPKKSSPVGRKVENVPAKSSSSISTGANKIPSATLKYMENFPASGYQAQSSITSVYNSPDLPPPPMEKDSSVGSLATVQSINNNESSSTSGPLAPSQIIYKGHKMVPQVIVDEKDREIKSLEVKVKNLETKVHRMQTLVNLKDQRLEDLTHQLHQIRTQYELTTQQTWTGYA